MRNNRIRKLVLSGVFMLLSMLLCIHTACAEADLCIQDFLGNYEDGDFLTISLSFNEEGLLTFSEDGYITNVFCDFDISGNVLTC